MAITRGSGRLLAIGGHEDKKGDRRILKKFVELAKGKNARIVVITAATDSPEEVGQEYIEIFKSLNAKDVKFVDVSARTDAMEQKRIEIVEQATGLYFTGGDQLHITSLLGGTPLHKTIQQLYDDKIVIGGTSAGAAMMSNTMILSGSSEESSKLGSIEFGPGMDFVVGSIIDTHFSQRGRHGRLITAVAHYPQELCIGLDEDTGIIVNDNVFEVIGSGSVTVIDGAEITYTNTPYIQKGKGLALENIKIHVLPEEMKFDLQERRVITPANKSNN